MVILSLDCQLAGVLNHLEDRSLGIIKRKVGGGERKLSTEIVNLGKHSLSTQSKAIVAFLV